MDKLWRLATAMFAIVVACGLFIVAYITTNGRFNTVISGLLVYAMLFCVLFGIVKGLLVIIGYHREHQDKEKEE